MQDYERLMIQNELKRANRRLRNLEKNNLTEASPSYQYLKQVAFDYDYARRSPSTTKTFKALKRSRQGNLIFDTSIKGVDDKSLLERQKVVRRFMNAKSSKVANLKKMQEPFEEYADANGITGELRESLLKESAYAILSNYRRIYGSDEERDLYDETEGKSTIEIARMLKECGFDENSTELTAPPIGNLTERLRNYDYLDSEDTDF